MAYTFTNASNGVYNLSFNNLGSTNDICDITKYNIHLKYKNSVLEMTFYSSQNKLLIFSQKVSFISRTLFFQAIFLSIVFSRSL